jgi:hypothetical protein
MMKMTDLQDKVLMIEELLTEKQLTALQDILCFYKEFQNELYNYPPEDTLFTKSQREVFELFDVR